MVGKKLYVGNLTYRTNSSDLEQLFSQYGSVQSAEVISDRDTGRSKGFGFVEMSTDAEAKAAIDGPHDLEVDGRRLTVNEARPREPRTGGGGGGGWRRWRWRRRWRRRRPRRRIRPATLLITTMRTRPDGCLRALTVPGREPRCSRAERLVRSPRMRADRCSDLMLEGVAYGDVAATHGEPERRRWLSSRSSCSAAASGRRTASIVLRWARRGPNRSTKSLSEKSPSSRFS